MRLLAGCSRLQKLLKAFMEKMFPLCLMLGALGEVALSEESCSAESWQPDKAFCKEKAILS